MSTLPTLVPLAQPANFVPKEHRASVRQDSHQEVVSRPVEDEGAVSWGARVRDISANGLGLVVCYPFKAGTLLTIQLQPPSPTRTLLARVVRATDQKDGSWLVGCELTGQLRQEELEALR